MNLRGRNKVSPEFSMSSMTDIVFLLLIFFMLTSPVITPEALDLILPKERFSPWEGFQISLQFYTMN